MDAEQAYMAAFLITGSHVDAELARARQRAKLAVCPICGDGFEVGDAVELYDNRNVHQQCVVACADMLFWADWHRQSADAGRQRLPELRRRLEYVGG